MWQAYRHRHRLILCHRRTSPSPECEVQRCHTAAPLKNTCRLAYISAKKISHQQTNITRKAISQQMFEKIRCKTFDRGEISRARRIQTSLPGLRRSLPGLHVQETCLHRGQLLRTPCTPWYPRKCTPFTPCVGIDSEFWAASLMLSDSPPCISLPVMGDCSSLFFDPGCLASF
jgi:hypothetical protein